MCVCRCSHFIFFEEITVLSTSLSSNFHILQVFTWGHRLVTPKRVVVSRNLKKSGNTPLKFHRKERLNVVSIAAGMVHSMVLTDDGALFYWVSSDPDLRCQQVLIL